VVGDVRERRPRRGLMGAEAAAETAVGDVSSDVVVVVVLAVEFVAVVVVTSNPANDPSALGGSYAMTVYTFRKNGTPRMISPTPAPGRARTLSADWMRPMQKAALFPVGGSVVRSRGCMGISGRLSREMVRLSGVVHGT
jgi:hypothetical protein